MSQHIVSPAAPVPSDPGEAAIEVAFGDATHVRIAAATPPELAAAVINALVRR